MKMTLNEYQEKAMETCMPSCDNFSYMMLNLVGEVGELASKIAKMQRSGWMNFSKDGDIEPQMSFAEWADFSDELMKEAGDILWQLTGLCKVMGWTLEYVAKGNLEKLASRAKRGVIDGNGDNR